MGADFFNQETLEGVSENPIRLSGKQKNRKKTLEFLPS
jgi:hypothetical protein